MNGKDIIARYDGWQVSYTSSGQFAKPNLRQKDDVKLVDYTGKTWCVTVPHGYIFVRRAHFDKEKGYITKASKAIVAGNCHMGMNRSAAILAGYLILVGGMSFERALKLLQKANKTRGLDVLTNPSFRKGLKELEEKRHLIIV
jgi:hypothetical protein